MQQLRRTSKWKGTGIAALVALLLSACAQAPDFGRMRESTIDRLRAVVFDDASGQETPALTGAERDLRQMSANLAAERAARDDDHLWGLSYWAADRRAAEVAPSLRYYERLRARHAASPASLLNALIDDIQADAVQMDGFAAIAEEVIAADGMRAEEFLGRGAAASTVSYEGRGAFAGARARIDENGRIIERTANILASHLVAYRTALAHARFDAPAAEPLAAAESAIRGMEERMALVDEIAVRHETVAASVRHGTES